MRRYPFERAPLQMMRSETVLIDQDGAEESSPVPAAQSRVEYQQQPMTFKPPSPAPAMSPITMPSPTRMDSIGPMTFQPSNAPRIDPALSKPASPIAALDPIQQARTLGATPPLDRLTPTSSTIPDLEPIPLAKPSARTDSVEPIPLAKPSMRIDNVEPMTFQQNETPELSPIASNSPLPPPAISPIQLSRPFSATQLPPVPQRQVTQLGELEPIATPSIAPPQPFESLQYKETGATPELPPLTLRPQSQTINLQQQEPAPQRQPLRANTLDPVAPLVPSEPPPLSAVPFDKTEPPPLIAPLEPRISPKPDDMPQPERPVIEPPKSLPELKNEPKQTTQLTDEQINALFSGVRQAPRVSLLGIPAVNKLFSEEYTNAERL